MVPTKSSYAMSRNVLKKRIGPRFSGFTLVELIVVITMLAILATVGFLALSGYSQDAKDSAIKANVRSVQTAISAESAITGNSSRYYVVHDTGAALSGAFVYVDGNPVTLTGGDWNAANANYSAGNPDYVKLKMNPEKFKVSFIGNVEKAIAAYDSKFLSIGAMEASVQGKNGGKRSVSWFQVAGVAPATKMAVVSGNFPQPTASEAASWAVSWLVRDPSLSATGAVKDGMVVGTTGGNQSAGASVSISGNDSTGRTWADGTYAASCNEYLNAPVGKTYGGTVGNGTYWIDPNGGSNSDGYKAYCDMTTEWGGWTLVMKVDWTKTTFTYTAAYWTNVATLNDASTDMTKTEYKGLAYSTLAYSSILMQSDTTGTVRNVLLPWSGTSLYAKISPDTAVTETLQSASVWNNFVPTGYLQTAGMVNGYNRKNGFIGLRVWAVGDNTAGLTDADSMSWFGGWTGGYHWAPAAGAYNWDQFPVGYTSGSKPTFGYLYVR